MIKSSVRSVNMGCMDKSECPMLFINKDVVDWRINDPKGKSTEQISVIRDEIERRVKELAQNLHSCG